MNELDYPTEVDREQVQNEHADLPKTIKFDRVVEWEWGLIVGEADLDNGYVREVRLDHAEPYATRMTEPTADSDHATVVWERDG